MSRFRGTRILRFGGQGLPARQPAHRSGAGSATGREGRDRPPRPERVGRTRNPHAWHQKEGLPCRLGAKQVGSYLIDHRCETRAIQMDSRHCAPAVIHRPERPRCEPPVCMKSVEVVPDQAHLLDCIPTHPRTIRPTPRTRPGKTRVTALQKPSHNCLGSHHLHRDKRTGHPPSRPRTPGAAERGGRCLVGPGPPPPARGPGLAACVGHGTLACYRAPGVGALYLNGVVNAHADNADAFPDTASAFDESARRIPAESGYPPASPERRRGRTAKTNTAPAMSTRPPTWNATP